MTNAFADDLAIQFQRITALHPQLLDAVPPAPIERRSGTFRFSITDFWPEFSQQEFRPRESDGVLVGPFRMYGHCLDPMSMPGELHWYDPAMPAQDGDIVLIQWDPVELQEIYERNAGNADWLRQYGPPCPIATKVYKTIGNSQWLLTRKSMLRLGNNRILGVLRKVVRPGFADEQCVAASLIEPNAATDTFEVAVSSLSVVDNVGPTYTNFTTVTAINIPAYPFDTQQVVSVNGTATMTNNATTLTSHQVTVFDNGFSNVIPNQFVLANRVVNEGQIKGPFSFEMLCVIPANSARTYTMQALVAGDATGVITGNVTNVRFKVEIIKR